MRPFLYPDFEDGNARTPYLSDQRKAFQATVAISANDDVIMDCNAQWRARIDDFAGHVDISTRWRRVTGWVIVHENDGRRGQLQRAFDNLAGIDRRMIHRTSLLNLVGNQHIFLVQK